MRSANNDLESDRKIIFMRVYILIAEGFECVETLSPIDVLHRAGVEVIRVAVGGNLMVTSSHNLMTLSCDCLIEDCDFECELQKF